MENKWNVAPGKCTACIGTGVIPGIRDYDDRIASQHVKRFECPKCQGTGRG